MFIILKKVCSWPIFRRMSFGYLTELCGELFHRHRAYCLLMMFLQQLLFQTDLPFALLCRSIVLFLSAGVPHRVFFAPFPQFVLPDNCEFHYFCVLITYDSIFKHTFGRTAAPAFARRLHRTTTSRRTRRRVPQVYRNRQSPFVYTLGTARCR